MSNQYRLVGLANSELLSGLSELVRQSNVLTGQLLAHLAELEQRMLHLELGFSSLFAYCVETLGMSEGTAGRRVAAARVCRRFPEVFERIARGELHLCALCALAPHVNRENAAELFETSRGKTRRQIEELLAARFPRPDVREQIRRLPTRASVPAALVTPVSLPAQAIDASPPPATDAEMPKNVASAGPVPAATTAITARPRTRELEPLSPDRFGVHFTADAELRDLIERARALARHRLPKGDLAGLMKLMAITFVREEERRRFGIGARVRRSKSETETETETSPALSAERATTPGEVSVSPRAIEPANHRRPVPGKRGRYLRAAVRRETHSRDHGRCAFVSADGRRCNAQAFLEFDHVKPFAKFGGPDALNIRLLCRAHNLLHARNCFGAVHLAAKIAARRRRPPATSR